MQHLFFNCIFVPEKLKGLLWRMFCGLNGSCGSCWFVCDYEKWTRLWCSWQHFLSHGPLSRERLWGCSNSSFSGLLFWLLLWVLLAPLDSLFCHLSTSLALVLCFLFQFRFFLLSLSLSSLRIFFSVLLLLHCFQVLQNLSVSYTPCLRVNWHLLC